MPNHWAHKKQLWVVLLIVLLVFTGGCTPKPASLAWEKVAEGPGFDVTSMYQGSSRMIVIGARQDTATIQKLLPPTELQLIANTDLSSYIVIVIYQGKKGSINFSIEVADVRQEKNTIVIYAQFHEPTPGTPTGQLETSPYYILRIRKNDTMKGNTDFVLTVNGREEEHQTYNIP